MAHLDQLLEYLKKLDEVQLCELLDISSEEILERFKDVVQQKRRYLEGELEILDSSYEESEDPEELNFDED